MKIAVKKTKNVVWSVVILLTAAIISLLFGDIKSIQTFGNLKETADTAQTNINITTTDDKNLKSNIGGDVTTTTKTTKIYQNNVSSLPNDNIFDPTSCPHQPKPKNGYHGKMIWIPGYPGSGSEMLRGLIRAMTGLGGADFYNKQSCKDLPGKVVTCKTHYPTISQFQRYNQDDPRKYMSTNGSISKFDLNYIILVRNPKNSIPSFCNTVKEKKGEGHTKQAPEQEWNKWRDKNFAWELSKWQNLFITWMIELREIPMNMTLSLLLPYEQLIDDLQGPIITQQLGNELERVGVTVANNLPCIWYSVVKYKANSNKTQRATHKYIPGFKRKHKQMFLNTFQQLKEKFSTTKTIIEDHNSKAIVEVLDVYAKDIEENLRIID